MDWMSSTSPLKGDFRDPPCLDWADIFKCVPPSLSNLKAVDKMIALYLSINTINKLKNIILKHPHCGILFVDQLNQMVFAHTIKPKSKDNEFMGLVNRTLFSYVINFVFSDDIFNITNHLNQNLQMYMNKMPSPDISIDEAMQASTVKLGSTLVGPLFGSKELQETGHTLQTIQCKRFLSSPTNAGNAYTGNIIRGRHYYQPVLIILKLH
jgi:hypothetical protein